MDKITKKKVSEAISRTGETRDDFLARAVTLTLHVDNTLYEKILTPTDVINSYEVGAGYDEILKTLRDKGIPFSTMKSDKRFRTIISCPLSAEDFEYVKKIKKDHVPTLTVIKSAEKNTERKNEWHRMYGTNCYYIIDDEK